MNYDVIIIGGGAAGFTAAAFLQNQKVLLIERNREPMRKLAITGKGRCNITNNCDTDTVLKNIFTNANFMRSSLARFTRADVMDWFENELRVPLKTERGGRVFPVSDKAADVVDALKNACSADIITERVKSLVLEDSTIKGVKLADGRVLQTQQVLVATGGVSYPATGSTGDGYRLAEQAGHMIIPPKPALVPLVCKENCSELSGLSLKNVRLTCGKYSDMGELLFTHFGISGPLVMTASCYISDFPAKVSIDFKPALDEKTLDARILREFGENKNKYLKNILPSMLPSSMVGEFIRRLGFDKPAYEINREERKRLVELFKRFDLTVTGVRPIDEAVITDGGVSVREVDPKTMQSKLVKGLYFAGEVLDIAAFTGGFNLQVAWSTARAAAEGIERSQT